MTNQNELIQDLYNTVVMDFVFHLDEDYYRFCDVQNQFKLYMEWKSFEDIVAHRVQMYEGFKNTVDLDIRKRVVSDCMCVFNTHCPLNMTYEQRCFVLSAITGVSLYWITEMEELKAAKVAELLAQTN